VQKERGNLKPSNPEFGPKNAAVIFGLYLFYLGVLYYFGKAAEVRCCGSLAIPLGLYLASECFRESQNRP